MATIRDVAQAAGVNPSTASRVLSGRSISVTPETRQRIQAAAEALGYQPNANAQNLRLHKTSTVGVLVPDLTNPFFPEILEGIRSAAAEEDFFILLANTLEDEAKEQAYVRILQEKRVDGLIIATAGGSGADDRWVANLRKGAFPFVLVCRPVFGYEEHFVGVDDLEGARLATEHLIKLGHRRIAHLSGPLYFGSVVQRVQGYRAALMDHGIPFDGQLVVETNFTEQDGYLAMKSLLASTTCTAVFAANDVVALGAMQACEEAGLRVPDEMSFVGFNDISLARRHRPQLTTIHMPLAELGAASFRLLMQMIRGESRRGPVIFAPTLMVRQSSGPPRSGE